MKTMNRFSKTMAAISLGAAALALPQFAAAEETSLTQAAGTITRAARHDFTVVIPRFLSFRVGALGAGVFSEVTCSPTAAVLGDSTVVTCAGGDAGAGVSNVSVRSNAGQITINVSTLGQLSNGADTLPYSEIRTLSSTANLPAPAAAGLPSGATSANVNVALSAGAVTNRQATWTYTYANTAVYAAGTYGSNGTGGNNGRATYTASSP